MKKLFVKVDEKLYLVVARYNNNDRLYIGIANEDEELYGDITINLSEVSIDDKNEVFLSDDLSNDFISLLREKKIIEEVGIPIQYNMGRYNRAEINLEVLKEYDPKGVEEFLEYYNKCNDMER